MPLLGEERAEQEVGRLIVRELVSSNIRNKPGAWSPTPLAGRRGSLPENAPHVLIVDEGRDSHAALERIALHVTATVHHARSIADALRSALKFSYDVLIVDSAIGGGTALTLLEQLRNTQAAAAILLSGQGLQFPEGFRLGGNLLGSVRKPWASS
jgi:CheY-like chemotaxis protein